MVNAQPANAAPITWPTFSFDPSLVLGARCISTAKKQNVVSEFDWFKAFLIKSITLNQVTTHVSVHFEIEFNNIPENSSVWNFWIPKTDDN